MTLIRLRVIGTSSLTEFETWDSEDALERYAAASLKLEEDVDIAFNK